MDSTYPRRGLGMLVGTHAPATKEDERMGMDGLKSKSAEEKQIETIEYIANNFVTYIDYIFLRNFY